MILIFSSQPGFLVQFHRHQNAKKPPLRFSYSAHAEKEAKRRLLKKNNCYYVPIIIHGNQDLDNFSNSWTNCLIQHFGYRCFRLESIAQKLRIILSSIPKYKPLAVGVVSNDYENLRYNLHDDIVDINHRNS